jgi:serine/threonine-protein kinase
MARVLDFGIALARERSERTERGHIKGKLTYMAPEHLTGGHVDRRADVYSAALVIWEMLSGEKPFDRTDVPSLVFKKLRRDVERPSNSRMSVADAVDAIVVRGFARDPDRRFGTAREMAVAVADYGTPAEAHEVADWVARTAPERLAEQRGAVQDLERALATSESRRSARMSPIATPSVSLAMALPTAPPPAAPPPPSSSAPATLPAPPLPEESETVTRASLAPPPPSRWRRVAAGLCGGFAVGIVLVGVAGAGSGPPTRVTRTPVVRTLSKASPFAEDGEKSSVRVPSIPARCAPSAVRASDRPSPDRARRP